MWCLVSISSCEKCFKTKEMECEKNVDGATGQGVLYISTVGETWE